MARWKTLSGLPCWRGGKESACHAGHVGLIPVLGRSPREGRGNPLRYSCLENTHRQRSLVGDRPWGCRESDTTEQLSLPLFHFKELRSEGPLRNKKSSKKNHTHTIVSKLFKSTTPQRIPGYPQYRLCDPMSCSLPVSSVQGILQARIPRIAEWVAVLFSRGSSRPRD